jgi:outer membrane receptor for ferrienterochelin and colicins
MANAGLIYKPHEKAALNLQYRYVGERNRASQDPRDDLKGYQTVDITGSIFNLYFKGLTLRAGITNLFDEDVRTPSPLASDLAGNPIPSYPGDYPHSGREWWTKLSFSF